MRLSNSYVISLLALLSEVLLAWFGKPTGAATVAAGLYVGARQMKDASDVWASKKGKPDGS